MMILLSLIASVSTYLFYFGINILDPVNVGWLMNGGDWTTNYLGWSFFRNEPWTFPLGTITNYFAPMGTSISLTDSIPCLGLFFKMFSSLLPNDFQYFGMWILWCYILQGIFGLFLMRTLTENYVLQFLGTMFFLLSPVLLRRGHFALMGQWLILASLWLYFVDDEQITILKKSLGWFLITFFSTLIQPYLTAMVFVLFLGFMCKWKFVDNRISFVRFIMLIVGIITITTFGLFLAGALNSIDSTDYGSWYRYHSMNLNALINPIGVSTFLKSLPLYKGVLANRASGQAEGLSYLGFGMILLTYCAVSFSLLKITLLNGWKKHVPLLAILMLLTVYSLSNEITFGAYCLFKYDIPSFLKIFTNSFRTSGRFFWPVYYVIIYFVLAMLINTQKKRVVMFMLCSALVIQIVDVSPPMVSPRPTIPHVTKEPYHNVLRSPLWNDVFKRFDRIVMYPPFRRSYNSKGDYRHFAYFASHYAKPITVGYVARTDRHLLKKHKTLLENELKNSNLEENTFYIISNEYYDTVVSGKLLLADCQEGIIDGFHVLFSKKSGFELPDGNKIRIH